MALLFCLATAPGAAWSQSNQFGGQDRADAAHQMIVLAVQQAISALPPASGQAFTYDYDPDKDTYVRSASLGPTVLRSPRPIGKRKLSIRFAASYFHLSEQFAPITYAVDPADSATGIPRRFAKLGLEASASIGLFTLAATYGVTDRIDLSLTVPVSVVDASASQSFTTRADALGVPPREAPLSAATTRADLDAALQYGLLVYRSESFTNLGFDFNDGTHAGVGRISVGGRGVVYAEQPWRLALASELYFPSPSEEQFAGPDSFALLGRAIAELAVTGPLRLLVDAGYEYDFGSAELSRFAGSGGAVVGFEKFEVDLGIAASVFDQPIRWTPTVAHGAAFAQFPATVLTAQEDNALGDDFVDFVAGGKVELTETIVLSGAVAVPLNDQGFRPSVLGTIAVEVVY